MSHPEPRASLRKLLDLHLMKTGSTRAKWLLSHCERVAGRFVRMVPKPQSQVPRRLGDRILVQN